MKRMLNSAFYFCVNKIKTIEKCFKIKSETPESIASDLVSRA